MISCPAYFLCDLVKARKESGTDSEAYEQYSYRIPFRSLCHAGLRQRDQRKKDGFVRVAGWGKESEAMPAIDVARFLMLLAVVPLVTLAVGVHLIASV